MPVSASKIKHLHMCTSLMLYLYAEYPQTQCKDVARTPMIDVIKLQISSVQQKNSKPADLVTVI